jgi:hypothetical protein
MSVVSITAAMIEKNADEANFVKNEEHFAIFKKIISVINATWPKKTPAHIAYLTGVSERAVQFWLAGTTRMSLDNVAALMKTDAGYEILQAIMGDCKAEWWLVTQTAQDVRKMRRDIKKQQDRIALRSAQLDMIDQLKG